MSNQNMIIVGISGVTNGGKSTLTDRLLKKWSPRATVKSLHQDDYFYLEDSPLHVKCEGVDHIDWEVITSIDMAKMIRDVDQSVNELLAIDCKEKKLFFDKDENLNGTLDTRFEVAPLNGDSIIDESSLMSSAVGIPIRPILLLDGFILYENSTLAQMCDLKLFFTLNKDECWKRRCARQYDPPDIPGYFEACVWPHYEEHLNFVRNAYPETIFLDGLLLRDKVFSLVVDQILKLAT